MVRSPNELVWSLLPNYNSISLCSLAAVWKESYAARSRNDTISADVIIPLSIGICHVLASLPENQRVQSFQALASPSLSHLERMSAVAKTNHAPHLALALSQIADEIRILATLTKTFTNATTSDGESMESGSHRPVQEPVLAIIQKGWPFVVSTAAKFCHDEVSKKRSPRQSLRSPHLNHSFPRNVTEHLYCYNYFTFRSHAARL
jgi:hypothetical protein